MFKIHVMGSAAGGGIPQWNCNCHNCNNTRNNCNNISERTQSSIAVTVDNNRWILINSSPDFRFQMNNLMKKYNTSDNIRSNMIKDVILMDSQIDHVTGLLSMRESRELNIYCTKNTEYELTNKLNILSVLEYYTKLNKIEIDDKDVLQIETVPELEFKFVYLKSRPPPYSKNRNNSQLGDNLGIIIKHKDSKKYIFYVPGLEEFSDKIIDIIRESEYTFLDGTVWLDTELIDLGISKKSSYDMGHIPVSKTIEILNTYNISNKVILIHINNTNPILDNNSIPNTILSKNMIEIAYDGMEKIIK